MAAVAPVPPPGPIDVAPRTGGGPKPADHPQPASAPFLPGVRTLNVGQPTAEVVVAAPLVTVAQVRNGVAMFGTIAGPSGLPPMGTGALQALTAIAAQQRLAAGSIIDQPLDLEHLSSG